jgi:hypothetical protein
MGQARRNQKKRDVFVHVDRNNYYKRATVDPDQITMRMCVREGAQVKHSVLMRVMGPTAQHSCSCRGCFSEAISASTNKGEDYITKKARCLFTPTFHNNKSATLDDLYRRVNVGRASKFRRCGCVLSGPVRRS